MDQGKYVYLSRALWFLLGGMWVRKKESLGGCRSVLPFELMFVGLACLCILAFYVKALEEVSEGGVEEEEVQDPR